MRNSSSGLSSVIGTADPRAEIDRAKGGGPVRSHAFTVVLSHRPTEEELDKLDADGLGDATFGVERGVPIAEFDREAATLAAAIASAVRELEAGGLGVLRVLDEDLVTLADIADRIGQSRESVRRYATGGRGPGGFPPPVNPARDGTLFYRWSEVAPWVRERLGLATDDGEAALVLANLVIQARAVAGRIDGAGALIGLLQERWGAKRRPPPGGSGHRDGGTGQTLQHISNRPPLSADQR